MAVYAELEWYDKGAVYKILRDQKQELFTKELSTNSIGYKTNSYDIDLATGRFFYKVALKDPVTKELQTTYEALSDRFGGIDSIANLVKGAGAATGNLSGMAQYFDFLTWKTTDPLKFQIEVLFFTHTNSLLDVIVPMHSIENLSVLSKLDNGSFKTPGINMANYGDTIKKSQSGQQLSENERINPDDISKKLRDTGKFMSIYIPGRIRLPIALVESVNPEYSDETTEDGSPLWGKLDIRFTSLFPANDEMLADSLRDVMRTRQNRLNKKAAGLKETILNRTPLGDIKSTFKPG